MLTSESERDAAINNAEGRKQQVMKIDAVLGYHQPSGYAGQHGQVRPICASWATAGMFVDTRRMVGIIAAHVGRARIKWASTAAQKFAWHWRTLLVWWGARLLAMPWPWMADGRPFFRRLV